MESKPSNRSIFPNLAITYPDPSRLQDEISFQNILQDIQFSENVIKVVDADETIASENSNEEAFFSALENFEPFNLISMEEADSNNLNPEQKLLDTHIQHTSNNEDMLTRYGEENIICGSNMAPTNLNDLMSHQNSLPFYQEGEDSNLKSLGSPVNLTMFPENKVRGRWKIWRKIGEGAYGSVFEAFDEYTKERVAVKVEVKPEKEQTLFFENAVYTILYNNGQNPACLPLRFFDQGTGHSAIVMDLHGPSLEKVVAQNKKKYYQRVPVRLCMEWGVQILRHLERIHNKGIVHCDMKPGNIVTNLKNADKLHIIDYGLAYPFVFLMKGGWKASISEMGIRGTIRYASITAHEGFQQFPKDDLESLGYILLDFLGAKFPWHNITNWDFVGDLKRKTPIIELCKDCECTRAIIEYFFIFLSSKHGELPDYGALEISLRNACV